jgi:8-oxo-dGTP pyrophosphatase MutT (NUDIX family)
MDEAWTRVASRPGGDFRIFRLRRDLYRHDALPAPHEFVVMESVDWVNVVPVTDEGEVVLVRQFRHGIRAATLEIPGGMVDGDDDDPAAAARRELIEETGHDCRELVAIGAVHPNPAVQDNTCHTFLAIGAQPVRDARPDPMEVIEAEARPLSEIPRLIASGAITHALVVAAFFWLEAWMRAERARGLVDGWR